MPRVAASFLRPADDVRVGVVQFADPRIPGHSKWPSPESPAIYFGRVGYVAQPKADKRGEYFVRAEVLEERLWHSRASSAE